MDCFHILLPRPLLTFETIDLCVLQVEHFFGENNGKFKILYKYLEFFIIFLPLRKKVHQNQVPDWLSYVNIKGYQKWRIFMEFSKLCLHIAPSRN